MIVSMYCQKKYIIIFMFISFSYLFFAFQVIKRIYELAWEQFSDLPRGVHKNNSMHKLASKTMIEILPAKLMTYVEVWLSIHISTKVIHANYYKKCLAKNYVLKPKLTIFLLLCESTFQCRHYNEFSFILLTELKFCEVSIQYLSAAENFSCLS